MQGRRTKVISISSGKGGVGKSTIVANMAFKLAQLGKKVLIFDGDMGMANIDIFFGIRPHGTIHDVITGEKTINEILLEVMPNIFLIPGGSGICELQNLNHFNRRALVDKVSILQNIKLIDAHVNLTNGGVYFYEIMLLSIQAVFS